MYTAEQLASMTGEKAYKSAPIGGQYFDGIKFGTDGKFYKEYWSQKKDERKDSDVLGDSMKITIVKIRRKLSQWVDRQNVLDSVEYDADTALVKTTQGDMSEKDAKARGAKVTLVLYALHDGEIVKLQVTGGSLYNPDDEKDMRLYSYLQSFGEDEHTFMFETIVGSKVNVYMDKDGAQKSNFQMTFKRSTANTDLTAVGDAITTLKETLVENDARDVKWLGENRNKNDASTSTAYDTMPEPKLVRDEPTINPEDIPF